MVSNMKLVGASIFCHILLHIYKHNYISMYACMSVIYGMMYDIMYNVYTLFLPYSFPTPSLFLAYFSIIPYIGWLPSDGCLP